MLTIQLVDAINVSVRLEETVLGTPANAWADFGGVVWADFDGQPFVDFS